MEFFYYSLIGALIALAGIGILRSIISAIESRMPDPRSGPPGPIPECKPRPK